MKESQESTKGSWESRQGSGIGHSAESIEARPEGREDLQASFPKGRVSEIETRNDGSHKRMYLASRYLEADARALIHMGLHEPHHCLGSIMADMVEESSGQVELGEKGTAFGSAQHVIELTEDLSEAVGRRRVDEERPEQCDTRGSRLEAAVEVENESDNALPKPRWHPPLILRNEAIDESCAVFLGERGLEGTGPLLAAGGHHSGELVVRDHFLKQ